MQADGHVTRVHEEFVQRDEAAIADDDTKLALVACENMISGALHETCDTAIEAVRDDVIKEQLMITIADRYKCWVRSMFSICVCATCSRSV